MTERNMSKRILEVKWIDKRTVRIKLEATKRRKVWMKVEKTNSHTLSCTPTKCQLYYNCGIMKSPLKKYDTFGQFCNQLFIDYPELRKRLGLTSINQVTPIKRIGT